MRLNRPTQKSKTTKETKTSGANTESINRCIKIAILWSHACGW